MRNPHRVESRSKWDRRRRASSVFSDVEIRRPHRSRYARRRQYSDSSVHSEDGSGGSTTILCCAALWVTIFLGLSIGLVWELSREQPVPSGHCHSTQVRSRSPTVPQQPNPQPRAPPAAGQPVAKATQARLVAQEQRAATAPATAPPTQTPQQSNAARQATAILSRVRKWGGQTQGPLTVTLSWNTKDDMDIHVTTPKGKRIRWTPGFKKSSCGGKLDVNKNGYYNKKTNTPVENVAWPPGTRPHSGTYKIKINLATKKEQQFANSWWKPDLWNTYDDWSKKTMTYQVMVKDAKGKVFMWNRQLRSTSGIFCGDRDKLTFQFDGTNISNPSAGPVVTQLS